MSQGRGILMKILDKPRLGQKPGYLKNPPPRRWNILRGDTVQVINRKHPEFGKQGRVQRVNRVELTLLVDDVNVREEEIPADPERGTKARTVMRENPVPYSHVNLVDPVTGFPTKVNWSFLEDGTKVRISKRSGAIIPRPEKPLRPRTSVPSEDSDTMDDAAVWAVTYAERTSKWADMRAELLRAAEESSK